MAKKNTMGLKGATDHGAGMRAIAAAAMPEVAAVKPQPFKKGGAVQKFALGGATKVERGMASKSGAPLPPKVKFHGKSGRGSC